MNKTKDTLVKQLRAIGVIALPEYGDDLYSEELLSEVGRLCAGFGIKETDDLLPVLVDRAPMFAEPAQLQFRLVGTDDPTVCELEIAGFPRYCTRMQSANGLYPIAKTRESAEAMCYALHKPYFDNGLAVPAFKAWHDPTGSYTLDLPPLYALKIYLHNLAVEKRALLKHIH